MILSTTYPELKNVRILLVGIFLGMLALSACNSSRPTLSPTPPAATDAAAPFTETPLPPQATSTPPANKVVLLAPAGADPALALNVQQVVAELAAQDGLAFETLAEITQLDLDPEILLMVLIPPDSGTANLAAANPQVQFLTVGMDAAQTGPNLSSIEAQASRIDQQGFLAGYLAAIITPNWRVGVISRADTTEGKAARSGFINGAIFFCGLCRPAYPPFVQYPLYAELAGGAGQAEQQAAADILLANAVQTVYLAPGAGDAFLTEYLVQAGVNLIGGETPTDPLRASWVATIRADQAQAIRQVWSKLLSGAGSFSESASLTLTDVNPALLSPGRQRLVENMLADLLAGYVDTGIDPQTGEPR